MDEEEKDFIKSQMERALTIYYKRNDQDERFCDKSDAMLFARTLRGCGFNVKVCALQDKKLAESLDENILVANLLYLLHRLQFRGINPRKIKDYL